MICDERNDYEIVRRENEIYRSFVTKCDGYVQKKGRRMKNE